MRILQISTYDISGGAARAAYRLHRGLRDTGQDCRMLVRYKDTNDDSVSCVAPENQAHTSDEALYLGVAIQGHYIDQLGRGLPMVYQEAMNNGKKVVFEEIGEEFKVTLEL